VRKLVSVVLAGGLLVALSACATGPAGADCTPLFPSGENSKLITATGDLGADPEAEFPTPIVGTKTQASVLTEGEGERLPAGSLGVVQITIYDGSDGSVLISSDYTGSGVLASVADGVPAFGAVAQCATVGSRVAAVGTASDVVGEAAIEQYQLPVEADDDVVLVADVLQTYLGKANGADQPAQAGFPSIVTAPDGRPGFTFASDSTAPSTFTSALLKAGSGAKVEEGDAVVLNYTAVAWGETTVAETTWDGLPVVKLATSLTNDEKGLIEGLAKGIVGQKVGSQVIVVVPPELGYASGSAPVGVPDGATLVYVVDILGIYQ